MNPEWMTSSEVAHLIGLSLKTTKKIPPSELPYWVTEGGHRKYRRADALAYIERRMVR